MAAGSCVLGEGRPRLPQGGFNQGAIVLNDFAYVIGGVTDQVGRSGTTAVYFSKLDANGLPGEWNATAGLPQPLFEFGLTSTNVVSGSTTTEIVYVVGGAIPPITPESSVSIGRQNADGTLQWDGGTALLDKRAGNAAVVLNGYLFSIGGFGTDNGPGGVQVQVQDAGPVYSAPIKPDGTIGA